MDKQIEKLTDQERIEFQAIRSELQTAGTWADIDTRAVVLAARLTVEVEQLEAAVRQFGVSYETTMKNGEVIRRRNPDHRILQESRSRLFSILKDLGMTAGARSRMKIDVADSADDPLEELRARVRMSN